MVSEALDGNPLALSTAADFMRKARLPPREYLNVFNKGQSKLLSEYSPGNRSIDMIFAESVDRIFGSPAELLFSMCCMLSLEAIPLWIFEEGSKPFNSKSKFNAYRYLFSNLVADFCC